LELDKAYPCLLDSCGTTAALDHRLVKDHAIDHLAVLNCASNLLHDTDIAQINILCSLGVADLQDGVDGHWAQETGVLGHDLGRKGSGGGLEEGGTIGKVNRAGHVVKDLDGGTGGSLEGLGDDSGVNAL